MIRFLDEFIAQIAIVAIAIVMCIAAGCQPQVQTAPAQLCECTNCPCENCENDATKCKASEAAAEYRGESGEMIYRVTDDCRIFEVHKNSEALTGIFTTEQHARFIEAAKQGDTEAKRRVLAEVLYSQYPEPAAASDLEFPVEPPEEVRREAEQIRDNNISQNWRD